MTSLSTALSRFRTIGLLEGTSFLLLLFVAMPLKYLAGQPMAVKVVGWAHGALFVAYLLSLAEVALRHRWGGGRTLLALVASFLPFGPFLFDAYLRRSEPQPAATSAGAGAAT
ncbi:MAG: DUF3817 domain-containing protein [Myxococcota bacterium]|nr:DUF3817 domain-containing protein [Myxococcota bacterium]